MMKKIALLFVVMALSVAFAETYKVSLWQPALLGGTELKAGNYKVDVTDSKVVFTQGKNAVAESAVRVEKAGQTFNKSLVRFESENGKYRIREIRIGGTNMIVVVN